MKVSYIRVKVDVDLPVKDASIENIQIYPRKMNIVLIPYFRSFTF